MNLMTCLADLISLLGNNIDDSFQIICVFSSFYGHHIAHNSLFHNNSNTVYSRVSDVVRNERLLRELQQIIEPSGDAKGEGTNIRRQLRKKHPKI